MQPQFTATTLAILLACIVVLATSQDSNRPKLTVELSDTRRNGPYGREREQSARVAQDAWVSKDGNWRAGGYVQHDRYNYGGGMRGRNTHGGLQVNGRF